MQTTNVKVENFRAHESTEIPLTQLGSLIGENNAGKSSILHAIQFALDDRRLSADDFRDKTTPVVVTLHLENITEDDLERVGDTHRDKISDIISNGTLKIVRSQTLGSSAESRYLKLSPIDPHWDLDNLNHAIKGKTASALREAAITYEPELDPLLSEKPKKEEVTKAWQNLVEALPEAQLEERPTPFPTGIANAIKPLFPSVIYIESVKDGSLEAKATGTSAFAKLLNMLFEEVEANFSDIENSFRDIQQNLSRYLDHQGNTVDNRLAEVKKIESVIEGYVVESFPGVTVQMDIPAPTLTMLLASADLLIHDGHLGRVSSKGDGLKRNVLFALLRSYADLRDNGLKFVPESDTSEEDSSAANPKHSYLLLFEEPELYLHPRAQRQLMAALSAFAQDHQVLVTTHSPGFFQPGTKGFTRLSKTAGGVSAQPVDLDLSLKDSYQVVRHENNEAAFFAQSVVLVEGDSDTFVYPHLARLFSKDWDDVEHNVMFVKIGGKGNITRYRTFFKHFDIPIHVIADLDALSNGFEHLTCSEDIKEIRGKLMTLVEQHISNPSEPNARKIKEIGKSRTTKERWASAQVHFEAWRRDRSDESIQGIESDLADLFSAGHGDAKLKLIEEPPTEEIAETLSLVISSLANEGTYVLRRGDLEYYCGNQTHGDKVATAMEFCDNTKSLEDLKSLHGANGEDIADELKTIFSSIFRGATSTD